MLKNIVVVFIWQGATYIVPLITVPYLSRVLGAESFGVLGVATNIVAYLILITDWGFSLTATQAVAQASGDPARLRTIFWDTMFARLLLGLVSFALLAIGMAFAPHMPGLGPVLLLSLIQVFAAMLTVGWFLQGLEKMVATSTLTLVARFLTLPLTIAFVHSPKDAGAAAAIQGAMALVAALVSIVVSMRAAPLAPARFDLKGALNEIHSGWQVFVAGGAASLYTQSNVILLGFASGPIQAGYFNGAERIRRAMQGLIAPITTAVYPRINKLIVDQPGRALRLMVRLLAVQATLSFAVSLFMFLAAERLTTLVLGQGFMDAIPSVRWMAAIPFIVGVNNALGIQIMLPLGMKKAFSGVLIAGGLFNLVLLLPLARRYGAVGASMSMVATEIVVTLLMIAMVYRDRDHLRELAKPLEDATSQQAVHELETSVAALDGL